MTIIMRKEINEQEMLRIQANSPQGDGWFYVTNMAIAYEVNGKGIYLNFIPHNAVKEFKPVGAGVFGAKKFKVTWQEPNGEFFFEFRTKQHKQLEEMLKEFHYSDLQSRKSTMKIPDYVTQDQIWNDCYYDEKRKAYITYNLGFEKLPNARTRDVQIQFDKDNGVNSGIIIPEEKISMKYGYPARLGKNQDGVSMWHLLPTMTDEMLTDEIVKNRLQVKESDDSTYYETESEQWIKVLGTVICEKESEIAEKLSIINDGLSMDEVKALAGSS